MQSIGFHGDSPARREPHLPGGPKLSCRKPSSVELRYGVGPWSRCGSASNAAVAAAGDTVSGLSLKPSKSKVCLQAYGHNH